MAVSGAGPVADWRVQGSYFEACNCEAICPCRSVGGRPGGPSSFGECFGALSWYIDQGHADGVDLSARRTVLSIRYLDRVQPSTPWEVVLYVDQDTSDEQRAAGAAAHAAAGADRLAVACLEVGAPHPPVGHRARP